MSRPSDRPLVIDLNAPVSLADVPGLLRRVAGWWVNELADLAPTWARPAFPKAPDLATLRLQAGTWHEGRWQIEAPVAGTPPLEIDASRDDKGVVEQVLQAAPNFSLAQIAVLLPAASVLRRRVELPLVAEAQIFSAVELQIDRLTPFKSDAVRLAVRTISRDAVEGRLIVDAAITPRAPVEALEQRLARLGFKPATIDVADGEHGGAGFDFSRAGVDVSTRQQTVAKVVLALVALGSWYFADMMWEAAREQDAASWQERIAELRPKALRSASLRSQLDAMRQPIEIAREHRPAIVLGLLKELTRVLPDTAQLTEFRYSAEGVEIAGIAADAPALISRLEASKMLKDVRFRSPVMRMPELNKDRFDIAMRIEGSSP